MSWASPAMSTRSGRTQRDCHPRPIWATSSEWVSRVRGLSLSRADHLGLVRSRRSAALGAAPGPVAGEPTDSVLVPGSAADLARLGHHPFAVGLVMHRAATSSVACHRRTVCQPGGS